jgi:hypothetical protein
MMALIVVALTTALSHVMTLLLLAGLMTIAVSHLLGVAQLPGASLIERNQLPSSVVATLRSEAMAVL